MALEIGDDYDNDLADFTSWILETGLWNGREVSWIEAFDFHESVQSKIANLLQDEQTFDRLSMQLAWIGSDPSNRALLAKEIQALNFFGKNEILQVGFGKSLKKFWKKNKKEILIGAAVVAVVTVVVVVSVCSGGAAAGAAAAAAGGGASLDKLNKKQDPKDSESKLLRPSEAQSSLTKPLDEAPQKEVGSEASSPPPRREKLPTKPTSYLPGTPGKMIFEKDGVFIDSQFFTHGDILHRANVYSALENKPLATTDYQSNPPAIESPSKKSWIGNVFEVIGKEIIDNPSLLDPNAPLPTLELSSSFSTDGIRRLDCRIGGINGMNVTMEEAISNCDYVHQFIPDGQGMDWVYNRSHGPVLDLAEIFLVNYGGSSPNTAKLLQQNWTKFHDDNKSNPGVKYLQICHSQGAIHVRNALIEAPQEIRDRVIVIAVAPAAVVSRELCYDSYNYACTSDIVPKGEVAYGVMVSGHTLGPLQVALEHEEELILLDPPPGSKGLNHDFQNIVYFDVIHERVQNYIKKNGNYL